MIIFDEIANKVLSMEQKSIKPLLEEFSKTHFLGGGTAIALHLGHRKSIDFDFFSIGKQGTGKELAKRIEKTGFFLEKGSNLMYLSETEEPEAVIYVNGVKVELIDFSRNPFNLPVFLEPKEILCDGIKTLNLQDLAAMKAYAMMYRSKWKDAVDLYYILEKNPKLTFEKIILRTKEIFTDLYQEEATLETILEDKWDLTEQVEYILPKPQNEKIIREKLINLAQNYTINGVKT